MKLQTSGVLGTSYAIAKLAPKRAYPDRSSSPTYNIYITGKGYIPYSKDSKKEDYGY